MAKARDIRGRFVETEASRARREAREAAREAVRSVIEKGRKATREQKSLAKASRGVKLIEGFYTTTKSGKKFFYPAILEYGTKDVPAQAPMRKSFDAKKGEALNQVITSIREGIRSATGT